MGPIFRARCPSLPKAPPVPWGERDGPGLVMGKCRGHLKPRAFVISRAPPSGRIYRHCEFCLGISRNPSQCLDRPVPELKMMQDADQIVTVCADLVTRHALDSGKARKVIVRAMLGDQPLPLGDAALRR